MAVESKALVALNSMIFQFLFTWLDSRIVVC